MTNPTVWWIITAALIGAELLSGTFFLLMLATGSMTAAIAAHLGAPVPLQMLLAAVVSIAAVSAWFLVRRRRCKNNGPEADDNNATRNRLDIGGSVMIEHWSEDGTASVHYRGAPWTAIPEDPARPHSSGLHTVTDIRHNRLVVRPSR